MTTTYQVNEVFDSIQGEGVHAGVPATFIRLQGCTVGCEWCDTQYTWGKGGTRMTGEEVANLVLQSHVVITGGEPTIYNLDFLMAEIWLQHSGAYIQLETSGQNDFKGKYFPSHITWSPKAALDFQCAKGLINFIREVKFVVDTDLTTNNVDSALEQVGGNIHISFMPEGTPPTREMILRAMDYATVYANRHYVRFTHRLQYLLEVK